MTASKLTIMLTHIYTPAHSMAYIMSCPPGRMSNLNSTARLLSINFRAAPFQFLRKYLPYLLCPFSNPLVVSMALVVVWLLLLHIACVNATFLAVSKLNYTFGAKRHNFDEADILWFKYRQTFSTLRFTHWELYF